MDASRVFGRKIAFVRGCCIHDLRLVQRLGPPRFAQPAIGPVPSDAIQPGHQRLRIGQPRQMAEDVEPYVLERVFRTIGL